MRREAERQRAIGVGIELGVRVVGVLDHEIRERDLLAALAREPPTGRAMRQLLDGVPLVLITDEDGWSLDCDTQADLDRARTWLAAGRRPGGSWPDA